MSARPWFKFFPADWRADTALRSCSLTSRAVWLEMITLMDEAVPRGHLVLNGKQMTPRQLALLVACSEAEIAAALRELEEGAVFSRTASGTIISRKMVRETRVSKEQSDRSNARWPTEENVGLFDTGSSETDAHMPEARVQKPEEQNPEARSSTRRKPDISIPEGFPDREAITKAEQRISEAAVTLDAGRQAVRFRDHAETHDRRCRDWPAAFRQWITKALEDAPPANVVDLRPAMSPAESAAIALRRHRFWMEDWKKGAAWDRNIRGPKPDEIGCTVPDAIMAEFGYTPVRRAEG